MRDNIKKKYPYMSSDEDNEAVNCNTYTTPNIYTGASKADMRSTKSLHFTTDDYNTAQGYKSYDKGYNKYSDKSDNEQIKVVERSLKDLEAKSLEMSRYIESLKYDRSRVEDTRFPEIENEKLKQEFSTLRSDNIIFREDINRLSEINSHLEDELTRQRNRK
jgi:hypothetical protein